MRSVGATHDLGIGRDIIIRVKPVGFPTHGGRNIRQFVAEGRQPVEMIQLSAVLELEAHGAGSQEARYFRLRAGLAFGLTALARASGLALVFGLALGLALGFFALVPDFFFFVLGLWASASWWAR